MHNLHNLLMNNVFFPGPFSGSMSIDSLASAIEECIFLEFRNTEMKYKNRVRSRIANLKVVRCRLFKKMT